jgi:hypothetical protein
LPIRLTPSQTNRIAYIIHKLKTINNNKTSACVSLKQKTKDKTSTQFVNRIFCQKCTGAKRSVNETRIEHGVDINVSL